MIIDKDRKEIVEFIEKQLKRPKRYGKEELRALLDFIFDGPPIEVYRGEFLD